MFYTKFYKFNFLFLCMVLKVISASELRVGSYVTFDGEHYTIKSMDVSKTGKHGHAKCRFEANSLLGGKKKVLVVPGHERVEVPLIEKKKAQVLSIIDGKASVMDSESFENYEMNIPEELANDVKEGVTVEYWNVEGTNIIKRIL